MEQNNKRRAFAEIMPKREAFIKYCEARGLDTSIQKDEWGAHIFAHSHIQAMWECWFCATAPVAAPAVDAAKLDELGKLKALAEAATDERAAFERWAESAFLGLARSSAGESAYVYSATRSAWLAWQDRAALVAQQAARIEELNWWQARAENHNETLRSIAKMDPTTDGERMRRWALDGLTGYTETNDQTMAKLMDQVAQQAARIAELEAAADFVHPVDHPSRTCPHCRRNAGQMHSPYCLDGEDGQQGGEPGATQEGK